MKLGQPERPPLLWHMVVLKTRGWGFLGGGGGENKWGGWMEYRAGSKAKGERQRGGGHPLRRAESLRQGEGGGDATARGCGSTLQIVKFRPHPAVTTSRCKALIWLDKHCGITNIQVYRGE